MTLPAAALVLAYNQEEYLAGCLQALAPEVDHIVVVHTDEPFTAYNHKARQQFRTFDSTIDILERARGSMANLELVGGSWDAEEPMRDAGLKWARSLGAGLCFIVDADEFYTAGTVSRIRAIADAAPAPGRVYWARGNHLFRGLDRLIVGGPPRRLPVAFHITPESRFIAWRVPTGVRVDLPDDLRYWHSGYVQTDARMWEKINTFGHAQEVVPGWYQDKWLAWTPETTSLNHKDPNRWPRTARISLEQLPPALRRHRFAALARRGELPR